MDQLGSDQPYSSNTTKVERRLVEKNRRNQMKILYSKLNSLLPNYNPKVLISLFSYNVFVTKKKKFITLAIN